MIRKRAPAIPCFNPSPPSVSVYQLVHMSTLYLTIIPCTRTSSMRSYRARFPRLVAMCSIAHVKVLKSTVGGPEKGRHGEQSCLRVAESSGSIIHCDCVYLARILELVRSNVLWYTLLPVSSLLLFALPLCSSSMADHTPLSQPIHP